MNTEHGEIIIYEAEGGKSSLEVHLHEETVWLTLNQMTELFDRDKSVISRHLNNIFKSGELRRDSVVAKNATTAADGKVYQENNRGGHDLQEKNQEKPGSVPGFYR